MPSKHIEARRATVRDAYYRLRAKLYAMKGGVCCECGSSQRLQIDHEIEDGKNHERQKSRYKEYRRLLDHPEEWNLRCARCHNKKTMAYVRSFIKPRTPAAHQPEKSPAHQPEKSPAHKAAHTGNEKAPVGAGLTTVTA